MDRAVLHGLDDVDTLLLASPDLNVRVNCITPARANDPNNVCRTDVHAKRHQRQRQTDTVGFNGLDVCISAHIQKVHQPPHLL